VPSNQRLQPTARGGILRAAAEPRSLDHNYSNGEPMDPLLSLLSQLGLGLATNAIYDLLKSLATKPVEQATLVAKVQNRIDLHGVTIRADTVISALTQNGFLSIQGSHLYAPTSLVFGSQVGGAIAGNNSTLQTAKTSIVAGTGAFLETQGNAQVRQNPDGSISFHTGAGGDISFTTGGKPGV